MRARRLSLGRKIPGRRSNIHLVPENLQAADVILQSGVPESAFFPQHLHLDEQLFLLLRGLPQLIGQPRILRRQFRDESGLVALRSSRPLILLLQLTPESLYVGLKLGSTRLAFVPGLFESSTQ